MLESFFFFLLWPKTLCNNLFINFHCLAHKLIETIKQLEKDLFSEMSKLVTTI